MKFSKEQLRQAGETMLAAAEGKAIQGRLLEEKDWTTIDYGIEFCEWDWSHYAFRPKPEPTHEEKNRAVIAEYERRKNAGEKVEMWRRNDTGSEVRAYWGYCAYHPDKTYFIKTPPADPHAEAKAQLAEIQATGQMVYAEFNTFGDSGWVPCSGWNVAQDWKEFPDQMDACKETSRYRFRPATTPEVRAWWEAMQPTDDPAVRVRDGVRYGVEGLRDRKWIALEIQPTFDWFEAYRIVPLPAPKFTPWDFATFPEGIRKFRRKSDGAICAVDSYPDMVFAVFSGRRSLRLTYLELLADYEQLNGQPCGTEVK